MLPTTPNKKALTDDKRCGIDASNTYRDRVIPEELNVALQNLGSRVRKSVTEGYNTQHLATFTVPTTPYSSPAKLPSTANTPTPIFRSANDVFNSVFLPGSLNVPLTPSPKKRRRAEELNDDDSHSDMEMGAESEVEDEQVMTVLGPDVNSNMPSMPRKIKPLRQSVARNHSLLDPFAFASEDVTHCTSSRDVVLSGGVEMDFSEELADR
ncbi:hypothetical protein JB92DRAFT_688712 [Gautieria morchelliformis]|nr:hypothetical protein JB92DRAFT_688712 [Gautieria morchelliformis]